MTDDNAQAEDVFMTSSELAKLIKVSPATLSRWRDKGYGPPAIYLGDKVVRYNRVDVMAWIKNSTAA